MKLNLKEYYRNFFNQKYLRDLRYIKTSKINKTGKNVYNDILKIKYELRNQPYKQFLPFLINNNHNGLNGNLFYQLFYYKNYDDYLLKLENKRFNDRLFFDFDIEDSRITRIKNNFQYAYNTLTGKERIQLIKKSRNQLQDLIIKDDLLFNVFNESKKLINYFESRNIKPYFIFSGFKGFHINVFFKEAKLKCISDISYSLANNYKKELNLKYLDLNVNKDAISRVQRTPLIKHEKTGLYTKPLNNEVTYDDFLTIIKKNNNKVDLFNIQDYIIPNNKLIKLNNKFKIEKLKKEISKPLEIKATGFNTNNLFKDMRNLSKLLLGEPVRIYKEYNSYKCPFHDDKNPSVRIYKNNFLCVTCNLSLNYFQFIKKYYKLKTDDDVKLKMQELNLIVKRFKKNIKPNDGIN